LQKYFAEAHDFMLMKEATLSMLGNALLLGKRLGVGNHFYLEAR
jgi:hypothetical protein